MKFPFGIEIVGDRAFRGDCPAERAEQVTLVAEVRRRYPDGIGRLVFHVKNEGKKDYRMVAVDKAAGMTPGVPDICIPGIAGGRTLFLEIKRQDHTKSRLPAVEESYLLAAQEEGCIVAICLGWEAGMAFIERVLA